MTPEDASPLSRSATARALPTRRKRAALNTSAYALARACGATMEEAVVAAGSLAVSHGARTRIALRLEARPAVREKIEAEKATAHALTERGWRASLKWACDTAEGNKYPDGSFPTSFDRHNAAVFLGKVRGAFSQQINVHQEHVVTFRGGVDGTNTRLPVVDAVVRCAVDSDTVDSDEDSPKPPAALSA